MVTTILSWQYYTCIIAYHLDENIVVGLIMLALLLKQYCQDRIKALPLLLLHISALGYADTEHG
jgi:hypothetical protein